MSFLITAKKRYYLLIVFLFFAQYSNSQTTIENTYVSGIWTKENSPYYIQNDIVISENSFLFIEHGVEIEFQGHYSLTVNGSIFSMGNYTDSIIFTINDTTDFSNNQTTDGGWAGINLSTEQSDTSFFNYCIFEYGKSITEDNNKGGVLRIYSSNRYNKFENCSFRNNKANIGGVVYYFVDYDSKNPTKNIFTNCNFINNTALDKAGVFYVMTYQGGLAISNCFFSNNKSITGGCIYLLAGGINNFKNNLFYNNYASEHGGAIYIEGSSGITILNCIFENNYAEYGAAISSYIGTYTEVINSTLINNYSENCAFYIGNYHTINIVNSIFWNEDTNEISKTNDGDFNISYSNIRNASDSTWFGEGCIDMNPNIIQFENKKYILDKNSLCINAGIPDTSNLEIPLTDFYNNPRIYLDTIDIGATEFDSTFIINASQELKPYIINVFPIPAKNNLVIESNDLIKKIILYDINGEQVLCENYNNNKISINVNNLNSGIFILKIFFINEEFRLKKIIVN